MKTVRPAAAIKHPIAPVCDENSRILILGSFPSVKSREAMFFYGHPQNRFWKVLAAVFAPEAEAGMLQPGVGTLQPGVKAPEPGQPDTGHLADGILESMPDDWILSADGGQASKHGKMGAQSNIGISQSVVWASQPVCRVPQTIAEKRAFLLQNGVAVWDVIASCEIVGSADSSIKNIVPNDLSQILETANIRRIFTNGKKADELYRKHIFPVTGREAVCLPSTSPANAAWSLERLTEAWRCVKAAEA